MEKSKYKKILFGFFIVTSKSPIRKYKSILLATYDSKQKSYLVHKLIVFVILKKFV